MRIYDVAGNFESEDVSCNVWLTQNEASLKQRKTVGDLHARDWRETAVLQCNAQSAVLL